MAIINIEKSGIKIDDPERCKKFLAENGITYERWDTGKIENNEIDQERILDSFREEIEKLKKIGGYTTADVINMNPSTPGLEEMLAKFRKEHTHSEDEVRFTLEGRGIFFIHPERGDVFSIEVERGDLISVPAGTRHWFDLCGERRIVAIRLFQNKAGWIPNYTNSGEDRNFIPVCFGPSFIRHNEH